MTYQNAVEDALLVVQEALWCAVEVLVYNALLLYEMIAEVLLRIFLLILPLV